MMQLNVKNIADKADMIINGYAFTKDAAVRPGKNNES